MSFFCFISLYTFLQGWGRQSLDFMWLQLFPSPSKLSFMAFFESALSDTKPPDATSIIPNQSNNPVFLEGTQRVLSLNLSLSLDLLLFLLFHFDSLILACWGILFEGWITFQVTPPMKEASEARSSSKLNDRHPLNIPLYSILENRVWSSGS